MSVRKNVLLLAIVCGTFELGAGTLYVGGSARLSDARTGGRHRLFKTLESARDAIRQIREGGSTDHWTVVVRGGEYLLERPFRLEPRDSDVTYRGEDGARILGARELTGWRVRADGCWETEIPRTCGGRLDWFDTLWANDRRLVRARFPTVGYFRPLGLERTVYTNEVGSERRVLADYRLTVSNDLIKLLERVPSRGLSGVRIGTHHNWTAERNPIASFDVARRELLVTGVSYQPWNPWTVRSLYYLENGNSFLDAAGEWLYDEHKGRVVYWPRAGERPEKVHFRYAIPGLRRLVEIAGDPDGGCFVHDVSFENLSFAYTGVDISDQRISSAQGASWSEAAIVADGARNCRFYRCTVSQTSEYGLWWRMGCRQDETRDCVFSDLGAGGVRIGATLGRHSRIGRGVHMRREFLKPIDTADIVIDGCLIEYGGLRLPEGIGVLIGHSPFNRVTHNEIHHLRYTGISLGWVWGYAGSVCQGNEIAYNRISHIGGGHLSDMGGIYMLGTSYGQHVHHNFISDVSSYSYGGWGIYTDEGSEGIVIENNIAVRTKTGGFHQNYGKDNVLRNNIFAEGCSAVIMATCIETNHCVFVAERNLMYSSSGHLLSDEKPGQLTAKWRNNLWFAATNGATAFAGKNFSWWQSGGRDSNGVFANPGFVNPTRDDWSLAADSPALAIGFNPIEMSEIGRRVLSRKE